MKVKNNMSPKEKYIKALQDLLKAQKEVQNDESNPFNLGMPLHMGLSDETFISDDELNKLTQVIDQASTDNKKFAKLWNLGSDILIKAKGLFL